MGKDKHSRLDCNGCKKHRITYKIFRLDFDMHPPGSGWPGAWRMEKFINGEMVSRDGGRSAESFWQTLRFKGW